MKENVAAYWLNTLESVLSSDSVITELRRVDFGSIVGLGSQGLNEKEICSVCRHAKSCLLDTAINNALRPSQPFASFSGASKGRRNTSHKIGFSLSGKTWRTNK